MLINSLCAPINHAPALRPFVLSHYYVKGLPIWLLCLFMLTPHLLTTKSVAAQSVAQQSQPMTRTVTADDVNRVASELWCPLCSGIRLDSCELKACEQMREEIAIKLQAGEDIASIKDYFVAFYGEQVLGAPRRQGWGWIAWLLPPLVILSAGLLLFSRGRSWIKPTPALSKLPSKTTPPTNPYEEQLDQELARYE